MPRKPIKSWISQRRNGGSGGGSGGSELGPGRSNYDTHDAHYPGAAIARHGPPPSNNRRHRVSFKPSGHRRDSPRFPNLSRMGLASLDEDDDICMSVSSNNNARQVVFRGKGRGIIRGRNSPLPHRVQRDVSPWRAVRTVFNDANWYRICIPYGHKYEKDYVLSQLLGHMAPRSFTPIMYKVVGNQAVFYVDNYEMATTLLECDRKISMNDGHKLLVKIKPGVPQCDLDDTLKERLKLAMSKRYRVDTKALDLSQFHQDADLVADYFCALFRPMMLMGVMDIVGEHIPNLEALNLDNNKLTLIERLNVLHSKFPKLKILHIGDNKIREINQLDAIKDLKLEELKLAGNPVCNKYKTRQTEYISDVRRRFPKLLRLDGHELPPPISFDDASQVSKFPLTERKYWSDTKAYEIALQFLQQYILIYDGDNRQPLLDAYHENACFSMTINFSNNVQQFNKYSAENRNLLLQKTDHKRRKLLKQGRLPVVSFISELPRTRHYLDTFTMDLNVITETMMLVEVTGVFKEIGSRDEPLRYFNRTFMIVPEGSGYCICNEQLHITRPTDHQNKQIQNIQLNPTPIQQQQQQQQQQPSTSTASPSTPNLTEEMKQQMTLTLSQQTNMNLGWSLKCLDEVQWNYDLALTTFQECFKRGQVPIEAFSINETNRS